MGKDQVKSSLGIIGVDHGGVSICIYINIVEFIFPAIDGQFIMNKNTVHVVGKFYL